MLFCNLTSEVTFQHLYILYLIYLKPVTRSCLPIFKDKGFPKGMNPGARDNGSHFRACLPKVKYRILDKKIILLLLFFKLGFMVAFEKSPMPFLFYLHYVTIFFPISENFSLPPKL